ncbi:MAG TPA: hypothetical protein ENG36_00245 [Lentisphaerae bacterium]|nr:hypothetical protein [Lentisphaerota bacterium]
MDAPLSFDATLFASLRSPQVGKSRVSEGTQCPLRLVGTFSVYSEGNLEPAGTKAILDVSPGGKQVIVTEGDTVRGYRVVTIARDHIELQDQEGRRVTLFLALGRQPSGPTPQEGGRRPGNETGEIVTSDGVSWGSRVMSNRWVLRYDALRKKFDEIMGDPEKLAALFLSFEDVIDAEGHTTGYELRPAVEPEFFEAIGLKTGDIIRCVNSMRMTSARRAQYFVHEFSAGRLGAVVLDIERAGKTNKLIYLIR